MANRGMTTQAQVRAAFWLLWTCDTRPPVEYRGKPQNELPCDLRCSFVDFVDKLAREGEISESLALKVTL